MNCAILKVHPRTIIRYRQVVRQAPEIYGKWHDIALLKLETPIRDVPLGQLSSCSRRLKVGDVVQLAGEGGTTTGPNNKRLTASAIPSHLQCVNMKVVAVSTFLQTRGHIFLTEAPNKDICYADAGGAAMYNGMIYGVISFFGADYACQQSTVIMDVCEYLGWIKQKTGLE
ncbi:kallikrein-13-like [Poecilia latipinna]|uniref:kallikrein-13-like n=1 Tax=Poecilia latipinna TaxID=48699 RepID=UPI00072E5AEF|nr:PREDICTED: kallikrein-13-like [Poecilia latipinna]